MNFVWKMTEENWTNLMMDHNKNKNDKLSSDFDVYGSCCIGNLSADIQHTDDDDDWYAFVNVFGLGIDDGYAETLNGNIPYALLNMSFKVPMQCKTFEDFKSIFEENFTDAINVNEQYKELANMPLGDWD